MCLLSPRLAKPLGPVLAVLAAGWAAALARADEPAQPAAAYEAFRQAAEEYMIRPADGGEPFVLGERSLLNWGNTVRNQERGSVFVWFDGGRPAVIGTVFTFELDGKARPKHEFHSLAERPLLMTRDEKTAWTPGPGIAWREPPGAPVPAATDRPRLTQMGQLARRFAVTLASPEGDESKLRLMSRPLLRYSATDAGIDDGAIFAFVVATDPEALLLVEAADQGSRRAWRYAFARFHFWKLSAALDGVPVWSVEPDLIQADHHFGDPTQFEKPYVSFHPDRRDASQ